MPQSLPKYAGSILRESNLGALTRVASYSRCPFSLILAAFGVGIIFVARDQQESVRVAVRESSGASNLSAIIDINWRRQCQARTRGNESVQVDRGATVFPQKPVCRVAATDCRREAHDLTF